MENSEYVHITDEQGFDHSIREAGKIIVGGSKPLVAIALRHLRKRGSWGKLQCISVIEYRRHNCYGTQNCRPDVLAPDSDTVLFLAFNPHKNNKKDKFFSLLHAGWEEGQIYFLDYEFLAGLSRRDHPTVDFCCVGFPKCGTTSLYAAFRKNKRIYLSATKETQYGRWKSNNLEGPERFRELYMKEVPQGKAIGAIEPTYHCLASFVYETFGPDIKLIFLMRSPVAATFSYYKMMLRRTGSAEIIEYYKKYDKPCPEMFRDYMHDVVFSGKEQRFLYAKWIEEYLQYYPREQMKFVIFEELVREPERILGEIQEFIGVRPKKYKELPHSNSGDMVSRNYLSARMNKKLLRMKLNRQVDMDLQGKKRFYKFRRFCEKYTLVEYHETLSARDRGLLIGFYRESITKLEKIIGRELKGIWY